MKASDMAKGNGRWLKMVGKMFSEHHRASSFVNTWENIDVLVAIRGIIRHLSRCGRRETILSNLLDSVNTVDGKAVPIFQMGV